MFEIQVPFRKFISGSVCAIAFQVILTMILMVSCVPEIESDGSKDSNQNEPPKEFEPTASPTIQSEKITVESPTVVDLQKVTPDEEASGEQIVLPGPGVPDPSVAMVQRSKQALAQELGIDISQIEEISVQGRDWPDTSLGCPKPDEMYAQVITPGYLIKLEAEGSTYIFHTDAAFQVINCTR